MKNNRIPLGINPIFQVRYTFHNICKLPLKAKIKMEGISQSIQLGVSDQPIHCPTTIHQTLLPRLPVHQSGAVLIISLIMLLLLTIIGTTAMQSTSLEEKMAGNMRDKDLAFQAAESALKAAEASLDPPAVLPAFTNAGTGGFYSETPTPDLSESKILKNSFWTANPVATSTVTGLGNGIATPKYIIQVMAGNADCPGEAIGSGGCKNYRITARATGGSTNAVVILESIYSR